MPPKWHPPDVDELVRLYLAGETEEKLAHRYGVTRIPIARTIEEAGVKRRSLAEVNRLNMARRTPDENRRNTAAAHAAVRGKRQTMEHRCKIARSRERRQSNVSPAETLLGIWLADRGHGAVPQKAIGPYNADLAVDSVAVEIFGGGWHNSGSHRARAPKRERYLLNHGWHLMIVWVERRSHPLTEAAADEVVAFIEKARFSPSGRGQKRVIWGDGKPAPRGRH